MDEYGNTSLHMLTKQGPEVPGGTIVDLENQAFTAPHMLFLINLEGCTPLDIAINELQDAKALSLIDKMGKFGTAFTHSPLRFVKRPNRLELKYEKAFTLAVLKNNLTLIQAFPEKTIKTCRVYMGT